MRKKLAIAAFDVPSDPSGARKWPPLGGLSQEETHRHCEHGVGGSVAHILQVQDLQREIDDRENDHKAMRPVAETQLSYIFDSGSERCSSPASSSSRWISRPG